MRAHGQSSRQPKDIVGTTAGADLLGASGVKFSSTAEEVVKIIDRDVDKRGFSIGASPI